MSGPAVRRRWGWSEGDVWTVGIGLALALLLAVTSIPSALEKRSASTRPPLTASTPRPAVDPPAAVPPAPVLQPPARVPQSLFGPLTPVSHVTPVDAEQEPVASEAPPPATAPLAAGEVRLLAALPEAGRPGAVAAGGGAVWGATDAPAASSPGAAKLLGWDALGALQDIADVPGQPSARTRGVTGLARRPDGSLVVADAATARVLRYDAVAGAWSVLARVPDVPTCLLPTSAPCQPGLTDASPLLRGVAVDEAGTTFVADAGQGTVWRLRPGHAVEPWYQSADLAGDEGVAGIAFDAEGHVLLAVTRLGDVTGPGAGALLRVERGPDGAAGARTLVSAFQAGDDPVDVAVGAAGRIYVPLRGADAVVVLDAQGVELLRVVDDALHEPTAVDLAAGRVLVTAATPRAAVLEVGVVDRPLQQDA